jgi:hypothetical protein
MKQRSITEIIGWYGFAAILGAYAASNLGWMAFGSVPYQLLNLTGAVALFIDAWPDRNWQVVALNSVWAAVAIISLFRWVH